MQATLTFTRCLALGAVLLGLGGCSVRQEALNRIGDALAEGGTAFAVDDDPELIRSAAPFSLKLIESLLAETPRHKGLLLAASRGFTQYAYAFLQQEAEETEAQDVTRAAALESRARRLYRRARDYGERVARSEEPAHLAFHAAARKFGLYVCQDSLEFVRGYQERFDGKIELESPPGVGTTLTVEIPLRG